MTAAEYVVGAELPDLAITWTDTDGNVINFATGWTFTAEVGVIGKEPELTKDDGFTGAATAPNLTISWDPGELDDLTPRVWTCQVTARHTATGKDRKRFFPIRILRAVA